MGPVGDQGVVDAQAHPDLRARPEQEAPARRERLAERLEREWAAQERANRERRARIERERAERERAMLAERERRLRERRERLRREREALRRRRQTQHRPAPVRPSPSPARVRTGMQGPVRRRARAAENRRRVAARRRGLVWPTAKAGVAVSVVLALSGGLGSILGLPVPGLNSGAGQESLANSAALFGVDPGTPPGLAAGYVFPVLGPHDFGEAAARFRAERYGHTHEGQDVFAKPGTPLVAVRDGVVLDGAGGKSFYAYGGGNSFVMYSPSVDRSFAYLHMLHPARVRAGDHVHAGQVIGQVGCTGSCDGPHLHFEIRIGRVAYGHEGKPIDPLPYLRQWPQVTPG
jgi:murein DD-endopeptidase MepM/ murein hydrolase activator NlpD